MNDKDTTLAARFFFKNCTVSIHLPGEIRISRTFRPDPGDVILDRFFMAASSPTEFISGKSDFYRFLDGTSSSNGGFIKKLAAIGYILCNKLPRGGCRHYAFMCVNEDKGACANGKTLFARAIAQLCNPVFLRARDVHRSFGLSGVKENPNLLILDNVPYCFDFDRASLLCTDTWSVRRKGLPALVIPRSKVPYLLMTSDATSDMFHNNGAFRRRFVLLEFSSYFGHENPIDKYIGRAMFLDWDSAQWHMFDNLMFYCVLEYLRGYARGEDIFKLY